MGASSTAPASVSTGTMAAWFATPLGQHLLAPRAGVFRHDAGRHLRLSRIADRTAGDVRCCRPRASRRAAPSTSRSRRRCWPIRIGFRSRENSFDLVVLPHALEFTDEPHQLLREVYRVIRPEGQLVVSGFNPFSLFGAKRYFGREQTMPWTGNFISLYRLKDWLALLGFEVSGGRLDAYVPPVAQEKWLRRFEFFEQAGDRWWPIAGGVYFLRATKRVARHARDHAGMDTPRAQEGARVGRAAGERVCRCHRLRMRAPAARHERRGPPQGANSTRRGQRSGRSCQLSRKRGGIIQAPRSSSTPTARARAIPARAAGARCSQYDGRSPRDIRRRRRTRPTTAWS